VRTTNTRTWSERLVRPVTARAADGWLRRVRNGHSYDEVEQAVRKGIGATLLRYSLALRLNVNA
jgi:hypothetical protein